MSADSPEPDVLRADSMQAPYYGLPPLDAASITNAPVDSEQRASLLERRHGYELAICSTNALLNAGVPINRLPLELLVAIMTWAQVGYAEMGAPLEWLSLLLVCRYWFFVASSTPKLWYYLWAGPGLNFLRTGLARSKRTKIFVAVGHPGVVASALACIAPHAHRIQHLWLYNVPQADATLLLEFIRQPLPALESFHATVSKTLLDPSDALIELTPENHPRLNIVAVNGVILRPSPVFRQLQTLSFSGCLGIAPEEPTIGNLLDILKDCVNAVTVHVADVFCKDAYHPPQALPSGARIELPKLALCYLNTETDIFRHILSTFIFPAAAHVAMVLAIDDNTVNDELALGLRAIMPEDRSGLLALQTATHVEIKANHYQRSLFASTPSLASQNILSLLPGISMTVDAISEALDVEGLEDVQDICRAMPLETITITLESHIARRVNWRTFLAPFRGLRALTLIGIGRHSDGAASLLDALASEHPSSDGTPDEGGVLCPELRSLRIEGFNAQSCNIPATVLGCVMKRMMALGSRSRGLEELGLRLDRFESEEEFERQRQWFVPCARRLVRRVKFEYSLKEPVL
ncbi:hypothetical protein ONZ51_g625 [Trametes cubensis]|uniref:F-box domain-containing protein n=1 Tax=Trametes cubensis TaxID=1111947 RepID=A0AAD7XIH0_9APHY|nr:hypothetical protein ONZ51_g625 [Trametes cubensis]